VLTLVPLGRDTLAVLRGHSGRPDAARERLSLLFSAFEAGMPLVGLALGAPIARAG